MARCLLVVEDSFTIKGRGLVPVPGIVLDADERLRVGDPLVILRPDGSRLEWSIGGFELIHCSPPRLSNDVSILLKGLSKEDVPLGSEIWSVAVDRGPRSGD